LKPVPTIDAKSGGKESWAVLDTREGDALLALTKDTKGAETLLERLEASERSSAHMAVVNATPSKRVPMQDPFSPRRREVDAIMRVTISQEEYRMLGSRGLTAP